VRPYDISTANNNSNSSASSGNTGSSSGVKQYTRLLRWRNKPKHVWDLSPEEVEAKEEAKKAAKFAR